MLFVTREIRSIDCYLEFEEKKEMNLNIEFHFDENINDMIKLYTAKMKERNFI